MIIRLIVITLITILLLTSCSNPTEQLVGDYRNDMLQTMEEFDLILAAIRGTASEINTNPNIVHDESFVASLDSLEDQINKTCDYIEHYKPDNSKTIQDAHYFMIKSVIEFRYVADNIHDLYLIQDNDTVTSVSDAIDSALYYIEQARITLDSIK